MRTILLLALLAAACDAQVIEVKSLFQPVSLSGMWKHQMGDDPRWSSPDFDDSAWPSVQMPEAAIQPGDGISWYRLRVHLPEHQASEPLALMIGAFGSAQAYEVFWNGQRAGAAGQLNGGPWGLLLPTPKAVDVPSNQRDAVIAIRLRAAAIGNIYRLDAAHRASWIGPRQPIGLMVESWHSDRLQRVLPQLVIAVALMMPAVFFLLLPLWRRDEPEYLWFGLWLLCATVNRVLNVYPEFFQLQTSLANAWMMVLSTAISIVGWMGGMSALFRSRITLRVWLAALAAAAGPIVYALPAAFITLGGSLPLSFSSFATLAFTACLSLVYYELGWRTSGMRDRVGAIHAAILTYLASNFLVFAGQIVWSGEVFRIQGGLMRTVSLLVFTLAMAILMNQRSARLMGERRRLSQEMESAAEVQSLLLTSLPALASAYEIHPVYLPASEVGGDFFQILDLEDGARLVLVGDVSGKGLKAAMLVAVVVGAVASTRPTSPAAALAAINRALMGRTGGGFVTACCARFDPDGTVTIANAGHPAPYADGREAETESGLPLGIAQEVEYAETAATGANFTFVSDGVIEAENAARELFGFDRTRQISGKSAQQIADAAKAWGQNDDITVVAVRRKND